METQTETDQVKHSSVVILSSGESSMFSVELFPQEQI